MRQHRYNNGRLEIASFEGGGKSAWREAEWRECWMCGIRFPYPLHYKSPVYNARNRGRFCSVKCQGKFQAKINAQNRTKKRCLVCKQFFKITPSKAARYKTCGAPDCVLEMKKRTMKRIWQERRDYSRLGQPRPNKSVFKKTDFDKGSIL